ncbi:MAG: hypothetical protein Q9193_004970 [Seirophora villosa]
MFLWTWCYSGLHGVPVDTVYGSRDRHDPSNRRISKETAGHHMVLGGRFDTKRTACTHADIYYILKYQRKPKEELDAAIVPLLADIPN